MSSPTTCHHGKLNKLQRSVVILSRIERISRLSKIVIRKKMGRSVSTPWNYLGDQANEPKWTSGQEALSPQYKWRMDSPIRSCVLPTVWRHVERAESTTQMMLFAKSENRWKRKKIPCQAKLIQIMTCGITTISRKPEEKERLKKSSESPFFQLKIFTCASECNDTFNK